MKVCFQLPIILMLLPALAIAQGRITNLSSKNPSAYEIYVGAENVISIVRKNNLSKKQSLSVSHGTISKIDRNSYSLYVSSEKPDTLKYYEDGKLVFSDVFTIKQIPYPIARLANVQDTVLTISQILANPFVSVIIPESNFKHNIQVRYFITAFIDTNGDTIATIPQPGYLLSDNQLQVIRKLKSGDKIYFSSISAVGPNGRTIGLPPFTIIIR